MKYLASKNQNIEVVLRDSVIIMPRDKGENLMDYLTGEEVSSHVMITDIDGNKIVVNRHDIRRISPERASETEDIDWEKI